MIARSGGADVPHRGGAEHAVADPYRATLNDGPGLSPAGTEAVARSGGEVREGSSDVVVDGLDAIEQEMFFAPRFGFKALLHDIVPGRFRERFNVTLPAS